MDRQLGVWEALSFTILLPLLSVGCSLGINYLNTKAAVNGDGDLTRCGADPRYLLGNIFETPIKEIWKNSPLLKEFRDKSYLPDSCRKCAYLERCGGGCSVSNQPNIDVGIDYLIDQSGEIEN